MQYHNEVVGVETAFWLQVVQPTSNSDEEDYEQTFSASLYLCASGVTLLLLSAVLRVKMMQFLNFCFQQNLEICWRLVLLTSLCAGYC